LKGCIHKTSIAKVGKTSQPFLFFFGCHHLLNIIVGFLYRLV
jgi:hypothetical protein